MACSIQWCQYRDGTCDGVNHSWSRYGTARLGVASDTGRIDTIGAGVSWSLDDETMPAVFVHINGPGRDLDTYMTWHEAKKLHEALGEAIDILARIHENGFQIDQKRVLP